MVLKLGHFGERIRNMESFEIWYWRGMEKISWTDRVRNEEILVTHTKYLCVTKRVCYLLTDDAFILSV